MTLGQRRVTRSSRRWWERGAQPGSKPARRSSERSASSQCTTASKAVCGSRCWGRARHAQAGDVHASGSGQVKCRSGTKVSRPAAMSSGEIFYGGTPSRRRRRRAGWRRRSYRARKRLSRASEDLRPRSRRAFCTAWRRRQNFSAGTARPPWRGAARWRQASPVFGVQHDLAIAQLGHLDEAPVAGIEDAGAVGQHHVHLGAHDLEHLVGVLDVVVGQLLHAAHVGDDADVAAVVGEPSVGMLRASFSITAALTTRFIKRRWADSQREESRASRRSGCRGRGPHGRPGRRACR